MHSEDRPYVILTVLCCVTIVTANLLCGKFVVMKLGGHTLSLNLGTVLIPFTFLGVALITEFYGKAAARFCVLLSLASLLLLAFLVFAGNALQAAPSSRLDQEAFARNFDFMRLGFVASMVAFWGSQWSNISLYHALRHRTPRISLWICYPVAVGLALLLDMVLVRTLLILFGVWKLHGFPLILQNHTLYNLGFACVSTVLFRALVWSLCRWHFKPPVHS